MGDFRYQVVSQGLPPIVRVTHIDSDLHADFTEYQSVGEARRQRKMAERRLLQRMEIKNVK